jgi:hypothetical protein
MRGSAAALPALRAAAGVDRVEGHDLLTHAVLAHLEILGPQAGDGGAVARRHDHVHRHDLRLGGEGRLLRPRLWSRRQAAREA